MKTRIFNFLAAGSFMLWLALGFAEIISFVHPVEWTHQLSHTALAWETQRWSLCDGSIIKTSNSFNGSFLSESSLIFRPLWRPLAATLALPGLWLLTFPDHKRAARHRSRQVCSKCGYDLRATPGHCPECGAAPGERK